MPENVTIVDTGQKLKGKISLVDLPERRVAGDEVTATAS